MQRTEKRMQQAEKRMERTTCTKMNRTQDTKRPKDLGFRNIQRR